jgi:hypothetical protein
MMEKQYKKLSVDFPIEEYTYLKMTCAKQGISMKDFVIKSLIKSIEEYEDELDRQSLEAARKSIEAHGTIPWEEMEKKLGWDKL